MKQIALLLSILAVSTPIKAQMGPATVVVAPVERRVVELTQPLVATIEPVTSTTVAAEEEGLVAERLFDEGQRVEQGQSLVRNKTDLLEIERQAARADLEAASALVQQAQADADKARREFQRIEGLFKQQKIVSEKEYRDAQAEDLSAQALLASREAEQASKQADLERLNLLIEKSEIKAPINGVVSRRHVEVGQWISQGNPVADVVEMDPLFVRVWVPEAVVPHLRVGDEARVVVDALGGEALTGRVEQIIPVADPATRSFPVKILLPNPDLRVLPGFFARAVLTGQSRGEQIVVPRDAVVTSGNTHHVVVVRNGLAVRVPVTLGPTAGSRIAVAPVGDATLEAGENVVIRGNEALRGGEQLNTTPAPASGGSATRPSAG